LKGGELEHSPPSWVRKKSGVESGFDETRTRGGSDLAPRMPRLGNIFSKHFYCQSSMASIWVEPLLFSHPYLGTMRKQF
jgi:hypothetical protein